MASHETNRQQCAIFRPTFARRIEARVGNGSERWFLDEMVVSIQARKER
jgi:hypothetical protein